MNTYKGHRFPSDIISCAVWLYYRFNLRRLVTATATSKIFWPNVASLYPETIHSTQQYENNGTGQFREAMTVPERGMRKFKTAGQAHRFVTAHAAFHNLFNLGKHLVRAERCRKLRISQFSELSRVTETEIMPRLLGGYTEPDGSKLKKGKGFLEPNFGVGASWAFCLE